MALGFAWHVFGISSKWHGDPYSGVRLGSRTGSRAWGCCPPPPPPAFKSVAKLSVLTFGLDSSYKGGGGGIVCCGCAVHVLCER